MAAVEEIDAIAPKAPAQSRRRWCAVLVAAAGFGLTVLVFYPGYSTADARYVYADAMAWRFGDWQSPAKAGLWRVLRPNAPRRGGEVPLAADPSLAPLVGARVLVGGRVRRFPAAARRGAGGASAS